MNGAGSDSRYGHHISPMLVDRRHFVIAPELPVGDDATGLAEYVGRVGSTVDGGFDALYDFFHDVPAVLVAEAFDRWRVRSVRDAIREPPAFSHPAELVELLERYRTAA